jgi:hypothetical protein
MNAIHKCQLSMSHRAVFPFVDLSAVAFICGFATEDA